MNNLHNVEDGPEADVINIERLNVLIDENETVLANVQNLYGLAGNMSIDPAEDGPEVPTIRRIEATYPKQVWSRKVS